MLFKNTAFFSQILNNKTNFEFWFQISAPLPKIPLGVSLRAHWRGDARHPWESACPLQGAAREGILELLQILQKATKLKTMETVNVKQLAKHELSVEQQLYYKEITEACVGSDESRRAELFRAWPVILAYIRCCPDCACSLRRGSGSTWFSTIWQSLFTWCKFIFLAWWFQQSFLRLFKFCFKCGTSTIVFKK